MYERRQSYRMHAEPGFDRIVLQVRRQDIVVRLRDTSETGLSVICDSAVAVEQGDELKVRTESGWFLAKVAHVSSTPEGRVIGLARCPENSETRKERRAQAWGTALVFVGIILAVPLVRLAWNHYQAAAEAAKFARPVQPAPLPYRAPGFGPAH